METTIKGKYLEYKGKPLVREDNIICYGDMSDKYIRSLMIVSTKKVGNLEVPENILVQILSTDTSVPQYERIVKQGQKKGLFDAFDIGVAWLERQLSSEA